MGELKESGGTSDTMEVLYHADIGLPEPKSRETPLTPELLEKVQVLLVVVKAEEWLAVFRKMMPVGGAENILKVHPNKDAYMIGTFGIYCAALVQADIGSRKTQTVVHEAVELLKPVVTIMVGTGFGLKPTEQKIGDVMVSQSLATYDLEKVGEDTATGLGIIAEAGQHLSPLFKSANTHNWKFGNSKIHLGLLLPGSKLVHNAESAKKLKGRYETAVGGEVEGEGLYTACHANGQQWIIVKGISHLAPNEIAKEAQKFAAAAATSLVLHVLSEDNLKGLKHVAKGDVLPLSHSSRETSTSHGFPVSLSYTGVCNTGVCNTRVCNTGVCYRVCNTGVCNTRVCRVCKVVVAILVVVVYLSIPASIIYCSSRQGSRDNPPSPDNPPSQSPTSGVVGETNSPSSTTGPTPYSEPPATPPQVVTQMPTPSQSTTEQPTFSPALDIPCFYPHNQCIVVSTVATHMEHHPKMGDGLLVPFIVPSRHNSDMKILVGYSVLDGDLRGYDCGQNYTARFAPRSEPLNTIEDIKDAISVECGITEGSRHVTPTMSWEYT